MSLINDALKKAQKQRSGEAPSLASMPGVGGESAVRIAKRGKPSGFNTLILRGAIGAGVLLILVVGGYFAFRTSPAKKGGKTEARQAETTAKPQGPATDAAGPGPAATTPAAPTPSFVLPIAPRTEPVVTKVEPPKTAAPQTAPAAGPGPVSAAKSHVAEPVKPAPAAPPPKLEPRAIQFIENIKVAGIRASATDSKVLMNDRVYRIGDTVEHELGLKLVGISSGSLTFEDERGGRYTRTF